MHSGSYIPPINADTRNHRESFSPTSPTPALSLCVCVACGVRRVERGAIA